jgi:hypothetical protein
MEKIVWNHRQDLVQDIRNALTFVPKETKSCLPGQTDVETYLDLNCDDKHGKQNKVWGINAGNASGTNRTTTHRKRRIPKQYLHSYCQRIEAIQYNLM